MNECDAATASRAWFRPVKRNSVRTQRCQGHDRQVPLQTTPSHDTSSFHGSSCQQTASCGTLVHVSHPNRYSLYELLKKNIPVSGSFWNVIQGPSTRGRLLDYKRTMGKQQRIEIFMESCSTGTGMVYQTMEDNSLRSNGSPTCKQRWMRAILIILMVLSMLPVALSMSVNAKNCAPHSPAT